MKNQEIKKELKTIKEEIENQFFTVGENLKGVVNYDFITENNINKTIKLLKINTDFINKINNLLPVIISTCFMKYETSSYRNFIYDIIDILEKFYVLEKEIIFLLNKFNAKKFYSYEIKKLKFEMEYFVNNSLLLELLFSRNFYQLEYFLKYLDLKQNFIKLFEQI